MKEIRNVDLRMVDISDFIIANIDLDVHACGTYEEIVTANRQKKPIIVRMKQGKSHAPDWLLGMLGSSHNMIFETLLDTFLTEVDHIQTLGFPISRSDCR